MRSKIWVNGAIIGGNRRIDAGEWSFWICLAFTCLLGVPPQADAIDSDTFGVRSNSDPASLTPNYHEFNNNLVLDGTLQEDADGFDHTVIGGAPSNQIQFNAIFAAAPGNPPNQVAINNGAIVNLGVTGFGYLNEAGGGTSDIISMMFKLDPLSVQQVTVTITLDSDPLTGSAVGLGLGALPESGMLQDMTGGLFNLANDPANPGLKLLASGEVPFHVVLRSDADVPEPSTWLLFGSGLAGLAYWRRWQAQ